MLTIAEAHILVGQHLGETSRARHSRFVGYAMRRLADMAYGDVTEWEVTGLCHDVDFAATAADRSQHGLLAAEWLAGKLPSSALDAIRATIIVLASSRVPRSRERLNSPTLLPLPQMPSPPRWRRSSPPKMPLSN